MGKYVRYYSVLSAYTEDRKNDYVEPWVSLVAENDQVNFNKTEWEKQGEQPLTFEITGGGDIVWKAKDASFTSMIEYKKNDGNWTEITPTTEGVSFSVANGDIVQFRGNNGAYGTSTSVYNFFSGTTCQFKAKGNIMSLINGADFEGKTALNSGYTFPGLFRYCTGLTDASLLVLPATALSEYCYFTMFSNCTSLAVGPNLPATTLANSCYGNMFRGCTNLTTAPVLPATTLANECYTCMFTYCTSLTSAPVLPATTLANECYYYMFYGCTNLTTAPVLPATTLANECYYAMFASCTSLTSAPVLPATTLADYCYYGMFYGCTSLTSAPVLPVTTLTEHCYENMFQGCTSLTTAPELPAATLLSNSYNWMFKGCTNLNYIKCLATDISAEGCTEDWVSGVASSGTFVKNPAMSSWTTGNSGIPDGWTVQNA